MKITYISHASLLIETEHTSIVVDPWFNGPAYFGQWHVFPKPMDTSFVNKATHLVLTHGHEDHYHPKTLSLFDKNTKVFFPFTWKGGKREEIKSLGFKNVSEVVSFEKVVLGENAFFTYVTNGLDAFTVFEISGKIIVNLNDALNASHKYFINLFGGIIRKHWKHVDYLICGLGGAGYFPNTVHSPLKNDYEIGMLREQFLAHKFCELIEVIQPECVIPFVPGFALLEEDKQWINELRFSRDKLDAYYRENFNPAHHIQFHNLLPGDYVEGGEWKKESIYHSIFEKQSINELIQQQYAEDIANGNNYVSAPSSVYEECASGLNEIFLKNTSGIPEHLLRQLNFCIRLKNIPDEEKYIHCTWENRKLQARCVSKTPPDTNILITTISQRLQYAIEEEWGGDVFFIGYGADIHILRQEALNDNLDILSLRVLSRFPSASANLAKEPFRMLNYFLRNPEYTNLAIRQKLLSKGNPNKLPFNERSHWINKSKCEVCRICDIPELSDALGEKLATAGGF